MQGSQSAATLSAVTATGAGTTVDYGHVVSIHTMITRTTGSPDANNFNVDLQLSHDGANWVTPANGQSSTPAANIVTVTHGARYARANLTALSGGSSPTVTATIAGTGA